MKNNNVLSIIALVLSLVAITMCSICCFSKKDSGSLAETLKNNPEMVVDALQAYEQKARDEQFAAAEKIIKDNIGKINNNPASPYIGPKDAKVVLAVFYDYSCGYCHRLYPILKEMAAKNSDVKFVYKPLTFLGPISDYSARAVIAANQQGKFAELNDALFGFEGQLTEEKVDELAAQAGLDVEQYKAAMNSEKTLGTLNEISSLANDIQVNGVPTMVLDGKILQTFDAGEIQSRIDSAK